MSLFVANVYAQAEVAAPQGGGIMQFVLLGGLFLFMYFVIIRPQRKRQKEHQELVNRLNKGDEVVLTSGMLGRITDVDETYISIEATNNVVLKFQKIAVHAVLPKGTIKSL